MKSLCVGGQPCPCPAQVLLPLSNRVAAQPPVPRLCPFQHVIRGNRPIKTEMAHQLYVLQVLTFNLLEERMMTKMDPNDQVGAWSHCAPFEASLPALGLCVEHVPCAGGRARWCLPKWLVSALGIHLCASL